MTDWQFEYNRLVNTAMQLNRMYKRKSKRLDKAIEFLDKLQPPKDYIIMKKELLKILKGE